jgi:alkylation response protein AidB-like acyl-CoA dehydrogenase
MAYLFSAEHAQHAAERALHFHGGYGFMQEYDIQLFYRRAKGWPLVLDSPTREYERLAGRRYGSPARRN